MTGGAWILSARRTIVAPKGGALGDLEPHELAAPLVGACLADAGLAAEQVDELLLGNALGAGGNPARVTALAAGLPERVAGLSLDRQCCGGLDAVTLAQAMIAAGQADVVLAGGVESYSRRPLRMRVPQGGGAPVAYDQPPFTPWPGRDPDMAEAAEALAGKLGISRDRQDAWAIRSHAMALAARDRLAAEIWPLPGVPAGGDTYTRALSAALCRRAPVIAGTITHANTSVAADAAALCLVVSDRVAAAVGKPAVRVLGGATRGGDPALPGLAPVAAIAALTEALDLSASDFATAEIMEAYAAQALACIDAAGLDPETVNTGGGSLARGHPIGASGAILAVRLFHELRGTGKTGLAAIAAAGGIGSALALAGGG